jgi:hypothetical protein
MNIMIFFQQVLFSMLFVYFTADEGNFRPASWWVSRYNQRMDYWGGSLPGSRKCECGIMGKCVDSTKWCNCDSGKDCITSSASFALNTLILGKCTKAVYIFLYVSNIKT